MNDEKPVLGKIFVDKSYQISEHMKRPAAATTGNPMKKAKVLLPSYMDKFSTKPTNPNDKSLIDSDNDDPLLNSSKGKLIQYLRYNFSKKKLKLV